MKFLLEIEEKDINIKKNQVSCYKIRKAARTVLFNDKNEIACQFISKHGYYKIPGGGVEKNETIKQALKRELMEELGARVKILQPIGVIIEYRNQFKILQISYCYLTKLQGKLEKNNLDKLEKEDGLENFWLPLNKFIKLMGSSKTNDYAGKFITKRDICFLKEVEKNIGNSSINFL